MAKHVAAKLALYALMDGTVGARTLLGKVIFEDGFSASAPDDGSSYGAIWIEWGAGEPIAIGEPRWSRQEGTVVFEAHAPIHSGDEALRLYDEFCSRYEGIAVTVEAGIDEILLRQVSSGAPGLRGATYVVSGRCPFRRNRLAAA